MTTLITGATGFVGSALISEMLAQGYDVVASVRCELVLPTSTKIKQVVGSLDPETNWEENLSTIDVVIHAAARAHVMNETAVDPMAEFRKVNVAGTLNLGRQAAKAGVKRFIFISSIKVNGEATKEEQKFTPNDDCTPTDPYAISKYEAEQGLLNIAKSTDMEVVIIRPPLVYGAEVKANFESMVKWVSRGIPLPFGVIHNQRSLVALDNLVSFIIHCIDHPKAANEIFLISDGEDISTTQLIKKVAKALDKRPRLIPVSVGVMKFIAKLMGKENVANRLFSSLQVDSSKARDLLSWLPVITMDEQLKKMAEIYRKRPLHETDGE